MRVPYPKTVTLLKRSVGGTDDYGNDVLTDTAIDVEGCAVWPRASTEWVRGQETQQGQDLTTISMTVLMPDGTTVEATDAVRVDGLDYEVVGQPARYESPLTGRSPGIQVDLRRVTG